MTQKQPADKLGISDKAVSKWERGLDCPDITLVTELSEILSVSLESLLSGSTETSDFKEVNMKKNKYYICPQCGNITVCTGDAEVSCCGRKLTAATPVKAAEEQKLSAEIVEDEWFISGSCPMTKNDCISFPFDHKPLWHKPSTSVKRRIEAVQRHHTNEKAARISEPLLPCKHKKTPLRI